MKKRIVMLAMLVLLGGCGARTGPALTVPSSTPSDTPAVPSAQPESTSPIEVNDPSFPATFTVPAGWIDWEDGFDAGTYSYMEEGHEDAIVPDNIAIRTGESPYSVDEHVLFREAIMQQLKTRLQNEDAYVTGSGSNTAQDYILYTFTIEGPGDMILRQHYILRDYGFCLIQVSNFTGAENEGIFEAAQSIVDSLIWKADLQQET